MVDVEEGEEALPHSHDLVVSADPNAKILGAMRDTVTAIHRAAIQPDAKARAAAVKSLVTVTAGNPHLVLQTWLDQFARTNGGSSPAEYSAADRVFLLQSLEEIIRTVINKKVRLKLTSHSIPCCIIPLHYLLNDVDL